MILGFIGKGGRAPQWTHHKYSLATVSRSQSASVREHRKGEVTGQIIFAHISNRDNAHGAGYAGAVITRSMESPAGKGKLAHNPPSKKMPDNATFCRVRSFNPHTICKGIYKIATSMQRLEAVIPRQ